ncbi:replication initiation protein [Frateuria aurantia]|uniref:Protein involved in initiation of plasmid replication n=1 Tax=Frateuria aurantia (strain ATCC 33424 / DSM 6220 / KCTC 2777 / LMG 1558 / NBRC 3245 / NCIMB 13370) TaxID=767434 RepID=H8L583_FRAAD|nr:replication initiation protein [Frateuria aurantia]AFC86665.1 protein involved in initiation of plasmid replication [Frateuria aurantia DSM 6220]
MNPGHHASESIRRIRNQVIIKSNDLIQASNYRLSFQQYKFAKYCIAMLTQAGQRRLEIDTREYCQAIGLSLQTVNYRSIQQATLKLPDIRIVSHVDGMEKRSKIIDTVAIHDHHRIDVQLSEEFSSQIFFVPPPYTRYRFVNIAFLSSYYSIRLYEMCKSWQVRKRFSIRLEDLRAKFMSGEQLATWQHFKTRALLKPIDEINLLTDLVVAIDFSRGRSRRMEVIHFHIRSKTPEQRRQVKSHIQRHIDARY